MNNSDDSRLITQVLQGNTNAYANLIQRHKDMVFTIARRLLRNYEDSEEMTQDTFIKAYQKLHTFEGKAAFSTWLYSIVYHNCISKLRKKKLLLDDMEENQQVKNILKADEDNALDTLTKKEQKVLLRKALERLPEDEQFLVQHFYSEELSVDELAGVTGLSKSNIKVKLHRIRKKLHDMLTYAYSDQFYD